MHAGVCRIAATGSQKCLKCSDVFAINNTANGSPSCDRTPLRPPSAVTGLSPCRRAADGPNTWRIRRGDHDEPLQEEATPEPGISGAEALRRRLAAWSAKPAVLNAIARDTPGVSVGQLQEFANGRREFSAGILQSLVKVAYNGHAIYDPVSGRLATAYDQPPMKLGHPPPPCQRTDAVVREAKGPVLVDPPKVTTTTTREGWAGTFFPITKPDHPEPERRERFVRKRPSPDGD